MRGIKYVMIMLILGGLFVMPTLAEEMSAAKIEENVQEAISMTYLGDRGITAEVSPDKKVTLKGSVETLYAKEKAFEAASKVKGVKYISNQIVVDHIVLPEKAIQQNIISMIELNSAIPEDDKIEVVVDNDVVFLRGKVSFYFEKMIAQDLAAAQEGVKGVVNEITVKPLEKAISDENLENYLMRIVDEQFPTSNDVKVDVNDGNVTIDGDVNSMWVAYNIEQEFAEVIGVRDIDNMLLIEE